MSALSADKSREIIVLMYIVIQCLQKQQDTIICGFWLVTDAGNYFHVSLEVSISLHFR